MSTYRYLFLAAFLWKSKLQETNPFACSAQQSSTIGADPFDTQPAQRLIQSMNKPLQHHPNSAVQWPANENSAPFAVFNENKYAFLATLATL